MTNNRITFKGSDGSDWEESPRFAAIPGLEQASEQVIVIRRIDKPTLSISEMVVLAAHKANDKPKDKTDEEWAERLANTFHKSPYHEYAKLLVEMVNAKIAEALQQCLKK